ncbi:hypothetical protein DM860_011495 [Cuscuta australis]|uniref:Uncharacterized protein n=1 Tax=Cuscuta australis TaxID=267555 RepID=A0A328D3R5_9ASTE|nr:hypothetical protein DM860_011495 [Cuscuta australis]
MVDDTTVAWLYTVQNLEAGLLEKLGRHLRTRKKSKNKSRKGLQFADHYYRHLQEKWWTEGLRSARRRLFVFNVCRLLYKLMTVVYGGGVWTIVVVVEGGGERWWRTLTAVVVDGGGGWWRWWWTTMVMDGDGGSGGRWRRWWTTVVMDGDGDGGRW